jgi:hypothetical protein
VFFLAAATDRVTRDNHGGQHRVNGVANHSPAPGTFLKLASARARDAIDPPPTASCSIPRAADESRVFEPVQRGLERGLGKLERTVAELVRRLDQCVPAVAAE